MKQLYKQMNTFYKTQKKKKISISLMGSAPQFGY